jgi:hypothetical protein
MPIHDLGYRSWTGRVTPMRLRFWVLSSSGIALAWKSRWLKRMLFFAWMPALYFGAAFFAYEVMTQFLLEDQARRGVARGIHGHWGMEFLDEGMNLPRGLVERWQRDPAGTREEAWSTLLWLFFRQPQAFLMVLAIGLIAPPLISQDVRSRAFLLYFSRPLGRSGYLLGKAVTVWFYMALITTLPALALYCLAVFLSPSLAVLADTWELPFRILAASAILVVPTTALALCFSSLTSESRYASFGWFAVWVLGWVSYAVLQRTGSLWTLVSLFHTLGNVQSWVFGVTRLTDIAPSLAVLGGVTVFSLALLFRRISAPMRI